MVEVVVTDEFRDWYEPLTEEEEEAVTRVVTLLEQEGVALGHPYSSAINRVAFKLRASRAALGPALPGALCVRPEAAGRPPDRWGQDGPRSFLRGDDSGGGSNLEGVPRRVGEKNTKKRSEEKKRKEK